MADDLDLDDSAEDEAPAAAGEAGEEAEAPAAAAPAEPPPAAAAASAPVTSAAANFGAPTLDKMNPAPAPLSPGIVDYLQKRQAEMAQARQEASRNQMIAGLARAGAFLSAGLAGSNAPVNQEPFDRLDKEANSPVQALLDQKKATADDLKNRADLRSAEADEEASDPDSKASKDFRATLKAMYPWIVPQYGDKFDQLAAADKDDVLDVAKTKATLDEKAETAKLHNEILRQGQADRAAKASDVQDRKDADAVEAHLDQGWKARGGQAGQVQSKLNSAERVEALIEQSKTQPGGLDSRQMEELAQATSGLLGGGNGAQASARVQALIPNTGEKKVATLEEFFANHPVGAQMQAFTDRLADTVAREKAVAQNQMRRFQVEGLGAAGDRLKKNNPDAFARALTRRGLSPDMIGPKGEYVPPGAAAPAPALAGQGGPSLQAAVAAEKQRRALAKAATAQGQQTAAGAPPAAAALGGTGYAYGGMVGGLPSSNFAAEQMRRPQRAPPALRLPPVRHFEGGGVVPGSPQVAHNSPANDTVPARLTPREVVLPLSVTQAKDPALAAYLFIKRMGK